MTKAYTVTADVSAFVRAVTELHKSWGDPKRIWFRGHTCTTHSLLPTLYRRNRSFDEASAFNMFWARGRGLRQFEHLDPGDIWDWYFAARHHGLPSRLLDWTANALVALFFATAPHEAGTCCRQPDEAARVWLLDPCTMNEAFIHDSRLCIPYDRDNEDFTRHWLPGKLSTAEPKFTFEGRVYSSERPIALYPAATNLRLIAQQGMFSVHGSQRQPLDAQLDAALGPATRIAAIDVERGAVSSIRQQLLWLGMNQFAVDADADGLAVSLTEFYSR